MLSIYENVIMLPLKYVMHILSYRITLILLPLKYVGHI
jgi:hypothetical protein